MQDILQMIEGGEAELSKALTNIEAAVEAGGSLPYAMYTLQNAVAALIRSQLVEFAIARKMMEDQP